MVQVERIKGILLRPKQAWAAIDAEPARLGALYAGYVVPLAAIGPVASMIGWSVFGLQLPLNGAYRVPLGAAARQALVQYVLSLAAVFVLALIIEALATTFGGQRNRLQAFKVAVYSSTAAWLAGVFGLIPALGSFGILGLYSLYLLYLGLPVLMKAPPDKAMSYTLVVIAVAVVLFFAVGILASRLAWRPTL
jgi:Yip1 domain